MSLLTSHRIEEYISLRRVIRQWAETVPSPIPNSVIFQATSQLKHPGFSTVLEIIEVSPALISVSDQVTVSYYLTCSTIPSVSVIPVKVGLFFNTALARTETITNMPNGKRRRLFISGNAPATAGRTPW